MANKHKIVISILDDTPLAMALAAVNLAVRRQESLPQVATYDLREVIGLDVVHMDHIPLHKVDRFDVWRHK